MANNNLKIKNTKVFELIKIVQTSDNLPEVVSARNEIINSYLGLVTSIACKYKNDIVAINDLVQEGIFGIIEAIENFDRSRSQNFNGFLYKCVQNKILYFLNKNKKHNVLQTVPISEKAFDQDQQNNMDAKFLKNIENDIHLNKLKTIFFENFTPKEELLIMSHFKIIDLKPDKVFDFFGTKKNKTNIHGEWMKRSMDKIRELYMK